MLWNESAINGYAIAASDGKIGTISDFLFDTNWLVRWLVVETSNWLIGRYRGRWTPALTITTATARIGKAATAICGASA
jgi:hypothetical protein